MQAENEAAVEVERAAGSTLDGRYVLDAFVARGGFGAVFRSRHPSLGCPVAIKVLTAAAFVEDRASEHFVEAFEREARIVAALDHPAIVRVLDVGAAPFVGVHSPYIVLEWIEGETLERHLGARNPRGCSPLDAFELLRPVFDAIASAHEVGVVHRDLKPSNVMVSRPRRGAPVTRVLDFGVAKTLDPGEGAPDWTDLTSDACSSFSLSHAAPEQIGRLRTGPWTDVHALALLLVEVLVGERAYRGSTSIELFGSISAARRPTPATFSVDVGPWEAVIARALSLMPVDRYANAAALLAALDGALPDAQRAWASCTHPAPVTPAVSEAPQRRARAARPLTTVALLAASAALLLVGSTARTDSARTAPTPEARAASVTVAPASHEASMASSPTSTPTLPAPLAPTSAAPAASEVGARASQRASTTATQRTSTRAPHVRRSTPRASHGALVMRELAIE